MSNERKYAMIISDAKGLAHGKTIAKVIIEECTDLSFFVGKTINAAHQNPGLPFDLSIRMTIVAQMVELAKKMGKHVTIQYY